MTQKRQIVNLVNFIRSEKGREKDEGRERVDYLDTIRRQIALIERYKLPVTYLYQYDALVLPEYQHLFDGMDHSRMELGLWLEIPPDLCRDAGIEWTGEADWDYHCHCDFPIGYPLEERYRLIDCAFEKFRSIFGYYPKTVGSWLFDAASARYMSEKYHLDALCNCKEQYGTDGYTMWGGYYGQAYYPAKRNQFVPAQTKEEQLHTPLFRMLGSDPVYQYDYGMSLEEGADPIQRVITLEPAYIAEGGGGLPQWVDWYFRQNFNGECLSFGYAQAGQENAFGWKSMKAGLYDQLPKLRWLHDEGKITVETMGETGRWFKRTYDMTPASAISCHGAFDDPQKDSVWYCTKRYRINLYGDHGAFRIRDIHLFDEQDLCPYEEVVCTENSCTFEALPVLDGNVFTGNGILAGSFLQDAAGKPLSYREMRFAETAPGEAKITFTSPDGDTVFVLREQEFEIRRNTEFATVSRVGRRDRHFPNVCIDPEAKTVRLHFKGFDYCVKVAQGLLSADGSVSSEQGVIRICF